MRELRDKAYSKVLDIMRNKLNDYSSGGNVDLANRPMVSADEMAKYGYDIGNNYATTYTSTFSDPYGNIAGNFTPIQAQNGELQSILTANELQDYAEAVIDGRRNDDLGLQIGGFYNGANAISDAEREARKQHYVQEAYNALLQRYLASRTQ